MLWDAACDDVSCVYRARNAMDPLGLAMAALDSLESAPSRPLVSDVKRMQLRPDVCCKL